MNDADLTQLLRAANPLPDDAALDPDLLSRTVTRTREVVRMDPQTTRTPRRRLIVAVAAAAALVVVAAVVGVTQLGGDNGSSVAGGVPLESGTATASCLAFSEEALAQAPIAFDGTVTAIDGERVTLDVARWYRGGKGETITITAPDLTGTSLVGSGVGFEEGERYLVSAYRDGDVILPSLCGFSVTYSDEMADTFARAFG